MNIKGNALIFGQSDMAFVRKFGEEKAAEMVFDYKSVSDLPFIYDGDQLSGFLGIGRKDLFYLVRNCSKEYRALSLKKKNGGTRQIYAPNEDLKKCQKKILTKILSLMPVSEYAYAYSYSKGKSIAENASPHTGRKYLLKLDIHDFFGSIYFEQVYSAVFNTRYFPKQVGVMLTRLCLRKNVLPQGAPTSPAVSNIVMKNFDTNIGAWCRLRGIIYTRYCDDLTFSSDKPLYAVYEKVKGMLEEMGFELNDDKTHFVNNSNRQSVTGITVNEKISAARDYKRNLRQEVYYCIKYGPQESIVRGGKGDFITDGQPDEIRYMDHLIGMVNFVLSIEPDDLWFKNAVDQLNSIRRKN